MPDTKYTTQEQIEAMRLAIFRAKQTSGRLDTRKRRREKRADAIEKGMKITGWFLFSVALVLLSALLISINMAKSKGEIPAILGFYLYKVESGSMEPTLPVGTIILSRKPKDPSALPEKSIVTFKNLSGSVVTHRIVEVLVDDDDKVSYRTKGDNPISSPDLELLTPERVIALFIAKIPFT